jgi:hypothetical protein
MSGTKPEAGCRLAQRVPRGSSLCRALTHFSREGYFLAPVYEWFTDRFYDCGHADARTSLDTLPQRLLRAVEH